MRTRHLFLTVVALAVVAAACGDDSSPAAPTAAPVTTTPVTMSPVTTSPVGSDIDALAGTSWVAAGMAGAVPIAGREPTLTFGVDGLAVSGSTGCNSYFADVTIGSGTLVVSQLGWTEMACMDSGVMEQESQFLSILAAVESFTLADGVLELVGLESTVSFVAPEPIVDALLDETRWTLDTLLDGDAATSVLATTRPSLVVDVDGGSLRGNTGCNDFGGRVSIVGSSFTVSDLVQTEIACESAVMDQEEFILDVLQNATSFEIVGDRLTLSTGTGRGLSFTAG